MSWHGTRRCALWSWRLLDWAFKRSGESVASWLGPVRGYVTYTGLIDATDPQIARATAERYIQAGFTNLKVKVGCGEGCGKGGSGQGCCRERM